MADSTNQRLSSNRNQAPRWRRMDLHLHTPGSNDYQQAGISYLDILRQAEARGLDIIAFTDHNTVAGFAAMKDEIRDLLRLEELDRIDAREKVRLEEYRRLLEKILVLPGFEFTATFGFHILGIFPPETPISFLEHLLLTLKVPIDQLRAGSSTVGATSDVLTAYRVINEAGGIVIAAHANSANGVAMRGLDFGGQTRIAYTQDPYLHCLEVTDLEKRGRYTTRRFFSGSKPEYPRAMRCIQGSDAHRLIRESANARSLGVGDRITEILLDEPSFGALRQVLAGNDQARTRPFQGKETPLDFVQLAREEGGSLVQAFHSSISKRGGALNNVLQDIVAMANTNGGVIYVGLSARPKERPNGIRQPAQAMEQLRDEMANRCSPVPEVEMDSILTQGRNVMRLTVLPGGDIPYAIDESQFYVRDEADTSLAVRDEIVRLVARGLNVTDDSLLPSEPDSVEVVEVAAPAPIRQGGSRRETVHRSTPDHRHSPVPAPAPRAPQVTRRVGGVEPPRTGVEVVNSETRQGVTYHTVRDLRNGNLINNVTRKSARKLWHYAITKTEAGRLPAQSIKWQNDMAVVDSRRKDEHVWYDLVLRDNGNIHYYYGVTDSGMSDAWLKLVEEHARE